MLLVRLVRFLLPKPRTSSIKRTVLYKAMEELNLLPIQIIQETSKTGLNNWNWIWSDF